MISVDKSNLSWKSYLNENDLSAFKHYRSNSGNKDSLQIKVTEIPRYGLVYPNQNGIVFYEELNEKIIKEYLEKFEPVAILPAKVSK